MNEVFEKILKRLTSLKEKYGILQLGFSDSAEVRKYVGMEQAVDLSMEIVQEVEKEYKGGWIPCDVKMPEERDSVFKQLKGTTNWNKSMFETMSEFVNATVEFEDGTRMVKTLHTVDGKWHMGSGFLKYKVIAWQPLPSPFQEIEVNNHDD